MLVPAVRCDDAMHGRRTRFDSWYKRNFLNEYYRADYLEKLLSDAVHKPLQVWNASISASLVSDQYLIVRKYLSTGRRPKVVILSLAPREFLDNDRKNVEKTATYSLLADFTSLPELMQQTKDPWRLADAFLGVGWPYYKARGDYKNFCDAVISKTTGHPTTMHQAQMLQRGERLFNDDTAAIALNPDDVDHAVLENVKPDYVQKPNTLKDIGSYKRMYLPINHQQFATQTEYLGKLLALLKKEGIPTVVVDVPLVPENYALLPPAVLADYRRLLAEQCQEYGATLVNPETKFKFEHNDYEDTVHMTASGGNKMFQAISDAISARSQLANSLNPEFKRVANSSGKQM